MEGGQGSLIRRPGGDHTDMCELRGVVGGGLMGLLVYDDVEFMLNINLDLVTHRKEELQLLS